MGAGYRWQSWLWPCLVSSLVVLNFALPNSDHGNVATCLAALTAIAACLAWVLPFKETPGLRMRPWSMGWLMAALGLAGAIVLPSWLGFSEAVDRSVLVLETIKLTGVFAAFALGFRVSMNDDAAKRVLDMLLFAGGLWAAVCILMQLMDPAGTYGLRKFSSGRLTGAFSSANSAGTLFGALTVLSFGRLMSRAVALRVGTFLERLDPRFLVVACAALAALVMTLSRGAMSVTVIGIALVALVIFWRRMSLAGGVAAAGASVAVICALFLAPLTRLADRLMLAGDDAHIRTDLFRAHFDMALHHIWFGSGLGAFNVLNSALLQEQTYGSMSVVRAAHNVYLQWFEETGLVGLSALVILNSLVVVQLVMAARKREAVSGRIWAILFAYLVFLLHGFTDYAFQEPALTTFVALMLGCGCALSTNRRSGQPGLARSHELGAKPR